MLNEVCSVATHEAMKADPVQWEAMTLIGFQKLDGVEILEMRNCACGSTLAKLHLSILVAQAVTDAVFGSVSP